MSRTTRKALTFIGLTYLLSYGLVFGYLVLDGKWVMPASFIIATIFMFCSMSATILLEKSVFKEPLRQLATSFKL